MNTHIHPEDYYGENHSYIYFSSGIENIKELDVIVSDRNREIALIYMGNGAYVIHPYTEMDYIHGYILLSNWVILNSFFGER